MIADELVTILGLEVDSSAASNASKFNKMIGGITKTAKQAGAAVVAIAGSAAVINSMTTSFDNMAQSVGLSTDELKAWGGVLAGTEFTTDHVIDLVEEMSNKIGESTGLGEQITPVKEAFEILGLTLEEVASKTPEEQFRMVTQAAKDMADSQKAAAAADILLGGEANKVIGILRNQEGSINDLLNAQREYNFLTEEGIKGAKESTKQFGILQRVAVSMGQDIAGKAGGGVALATAALTAFIVKNHELIDVIASQGLDGIALGFEMFGDAVGAAYDYVKDLIGPVGDLFEGLDATNVIAVTVAATLGIIAAAAIYAAAPFIAMGAAIAGAVIAIEDLYQWLSGGDSVIGGFVDAFAERFPNIADAVSGVTDSIMESFKNAFDWILSMIEPVKETLSSIGDFFSGTIMTGLDKLDSFFADDKPEAPITPQQIMNTGGNTNNNVTQNINGAGDPRMVADRTVYGLGLNSMAATGSYSYNKRPQ